MKLISPAFNNGSLIPQQYTGLGGDQSPPLVWSEVPPNTQAFALICDDPDAPSRAHPRLEGPWVHWVIFNIPAAERQLPAAMPTRPELDSPAGAAQGLNDFGSPGNIGYRGPMPPPGSGPHRYFFKLYALDQPLGLSAAKATKQALLAAMQGHVLAEAELKGLFKRG